jgi:hypothetical protein
MYRPTTSRTLSTNCGSSDHSNVSVSHGFNPTPARSPSCVQITVGGIGRFDFGRGAAIS